jgi:hypothetical protein
MSDDKVKIDPNFAPPRARNEGPQSRRTRQVAWATSAIAVFAFGWLFGASTSSPGSQDPVAPSTTASAAATPTTTEPASNEEDAVEESTGLAAPLHFAVPGFVDTITMLVWEDTSVTVQRWAPDQPAPEVLISYPLDDAGFGSPIGIDASGTYLARLTPGGWFPTGALFIDTLPEAAALGRGAAEAVAVRVEQATWHETEAGRIAWVEFARGDVERVATLRTLDFSPGDGAAIVDVLEVPLKDGEYVYPSGWSGDLLILRVWDERDMEPSSTWIVDADDGSIRKVEGFELVAIGPDGSTIWSPVDLEGDDSTGSYLLAPDHSDRLPVPGLDSGERVSGAAWSPDARRLALTVKPVGLERDVDPPLEVRIVDVGDGSTTSLDLEGGDAWGLTWSPDGESLAMNVGTWVGMTTHVVQTTHAETMIDLVVAESADEGWLHEPQWSTDGRFLVTPHELPGEFGPGESQLVIHDLDTGSTYLVPLPGSPSDLQLGGMRPPVDPDGNGDIGPPDDEGILSGSPDTLPLGTITSLPESERLDFLATTCGSDSCYRDAEMIRETVEYTDDGIEVDFAERPSAGIGAWTAGKPFHVFHGFVNEGDEPLAPGHEVVLFVTRVMGPDLADGSYAIGQTYRFQADYVLRGTVNECGPTYRDQGYPVTCEWSVHDFPEGLPEGRYDIWAAWFAPCSTWESLGLLDRCDDPTAVTSEFGGGVNMPFGAW